MTKKQAPICPYCGKTAVLTNGREIYPMRRELHRKPIWKCPTPICEAYVGCHPGTEIPLGRLANPKLRRAKMAAHRVFDPIWRGDNTQPGDRRKAYRWLAEQLGIDPNECHIGMFDEATCWRVVEICKERHAA